MAADDVTLHETWLAVARAAAEHRRIVGAGDEVFYGDLTLREQRRRAGVGRADPGDSLARLMWRWGRRRSLDALCSGDPRLEVSEAVELVEWARSRDERLRDLNRRCCAIC